MTQPNEDLTPKDVSRMHANADVDSSTVALHHTLGIGANQASPGLHTHNGKNSKRLGKEVGKGFDLAFPTTATVGYTQAQMQSVIDALRDLGFGT